MEKTIKNLRKAKGLTQEQLGEMIQKSKTYIADLENGKRDLNGIAGHTLVKLAEALDTQAELLINPPELLNDEEFEWEKIYDTGDDDNDYFLVVDQAIYKENVTLFEIDGVWYKSVIHNGNFCKSKPIGEQLVLLKKVITPERHSTIRSDYVRGKYVPRGGFEVPLGREITRSELDEIIARYQLTEDDISNEFVDKVGAIYGKYQKIYTAVQIRVDETEAIPLEAELRKKGIEAGNIAPGRVNVRVK